MLCYQRLFGTALIVLPEGAMYLGESSGTVGIPAETMEPLDPISRTIVPKEEDADEEDVVPTIGTKSLISVINSGVSSLLLPSSSHWYQLPTFPWSWSRPRVYLLLREITIGWQCPLSFSISFL